MDEYIVGSDVLVRLLQEVAQSFRRGERADNVSEEAAFLEDLGRLATKYCGGYFEHVTLHRRRLGELAVKVTLDDADPRTRTWHRCRIEH